MLSLSLSSLSLSFFLSFPFCSCRLPSWCRVYSFLSNSTMEKNQNRHHGLQSRDEGPSTRKLQIIEVRVGEGCSALYATASCYVVVLIAWRTAVRWWMRLLWLCKLLWVVFPKCVFFYHCEKNIKHHAHFLKHVEVKLNYAHMDGTIRVYPVFISCLFQQVFRCVPKHSH